ncbi:MAG: hypothetical protein Q7J80_02190, partial [Anaerolineales bacterium]|nr:hypothetical protein [Anaerolineales bacterium]
TFETLLGQFNGEDVVLAFAEKVISQPLGAGITPSAPPTMSSPADASSALSTGDRFLEDLAREDYKDADFAAPGTLTYTIPLIKEENLIWIYAWCTTSKEILDQNLKNIEVRFTLNGKAVALDKFQVEDFQNDTQWCKLFYTSLSNWTPGEHHLTTTAIFTAPLNDGMADYEAGDYVMDYTVYVKP